MLANPRLRSSNVFLLIPPPSLSPSLAVSILPERDDIHEQITGNGALLMCQEGAEGFQQFSSRRMPCLPGLFSERFGFTPMALNFLPMPGPWQMWRIEEQTSLFSSFHFCPFFCLPACQSGFFKPAQGDEACLPCPINSRTTNDGATNCVCRNNYYRTDSDPIQMPCTSKSPQ